MNGPNAVPALDPKPLAAAILKKDKQELERLLDHAWDPSYYENMMRMTPLHLAVGWPEGLQALLMEASPDLIEVRDSAHKTALEYALYCSINLCCNWWHNTMCKNCDCYKSAELLLEYNAIIPNIIQLCCSMRTRMVLLQHLKTRCLRFRTLISKRRQLIDRRMQNGWDIGLPAIYKFLEETGVAIPRTLGNQFKGWRSVYSRIQDTATADAAYSLGFRDINDGTVGDWFRLRREGFGLGVWGLTHGGSLTVPYRNGTVAHGIMDGISRSAVEGEQETTLRLLNLVCPLKSGDGCTCKCSKGGCYPLNIYLRRMHPYHLALELLEASGVDLGRASWLPYHCIQALVFEKLGMHHTCCQDNDDTLRHDWEVSVDDGELMAMFDVVVKDLEDRFRRSGETFRQFAEGTLREKTNDVRTKLEAQSLKDDSKRKLETFGSVWGPDVARPVTTEMHMDKADPKFWLGIMDMIMPELGDCSRDHSPFTTNYDLPFELLAPRRG